MVNLTVYGSENAACTQKVLILLEELNLKYKFESIDLSQNEHKTPEYMKMQPFGKIPVIQYGDHTIFESRSILRYIASNNQDKNGYSIADISHIPYFNYFIKCGYKQVLKKYPNVYNWLKRIMKREYVKRVLKPETEVADT